MADEAREIAEEAVDRLRRIGDTYSAVLFGRLEEVEAWACIENILRGPPPEGEIRHYVLADKLAALPAPESQQLGPQERTDVDVARLAYDSGRGIERFGLGCLLSIIDRLTTAAPVPEGVPTVDDLEAYIDLALIRWVPGDDAGLARHIADSIHPRLIPLSDTPHEEGAQP